MRIINRIKKKEKNLFYKRKSFELIVPIHDSSYLSLMMLLPGLAYGRSPMMMARYKCLWLVMMTVN